MLIIMKTNFSQKIFYLRRFSIFERQHFYCKLFDLFLAKLGTFKFSGHMFLF